MADDAPSRRTLLPCPFCGKDLYLKRGKINPTAYCVTEECPSSRMSAVNLDDTRSIAAWNTRAARIPDGNVTEAVAQWLHDETAHPDSYPDYTWPETERDDGRRGNGGWVKIVPQHAQAYFRDIAKRLVARFGSSLSEAPVSVPAVVRDEAAWRWYKDGVIVEVSEQHARHVFDRWKFLSDDRGSATLMLDQLWAEIDRLRAALSQPPPVEAVPVAWMMPEHVEAYRLGKKDGIAWANHSKNDAYTVPLYSHPATECEGKS
jgi:hypothetical protein